MTGDETTGTYRAFVCQTLNEWGYPAKDRSGKLDVLEEPHLGKLLTKMSGGQNQSERELTFVDPAKQPTSSNEGVTNNA